MQQTSKIPIAYPDDSAQEMALLGSSYASVRIASVRFNTILDILEAELEEILSRLDSESVIMVLDTVPDVVFSDIDIEDGDIKEFVIDVRQAVRNILAIEFLKQKQESMIRTGRLIGDAEFSAHMSNRGPDSNLRLASCLRKPGETVMHNE